MKNIISISFILNMIFFLIIPSWNANAADFGQAPLGDIIYLDKDIDGNIIAMDNLGKRAKFNYVNWEVLNDNILSSTYQFSYDPTTKKIIFYPSYYSQYYPFKLYDTQLNRWEDPPFTAQYDTFYYKGDYYKWVWENKDEWNVTPVIYKWNYSTGKFDEFARDINTTMTKSVYSQEPIRILNPTSNKMVYYHWQRSTLIYFDFTNSTFFTSNSFSYRYFLDSHYNYYSNNVIYLNLTGQTNPSSGVNFNLGSNFQRGGISKEYNNKLVSIKNADNTYFLYNNLNFVENTNLFRILTFITDKYDNTIYGGEGGRILVKTSTGQFTADSNIYTDYVLGDTKEAVDEAKDAAQNAESAANAAKTAAEATNTIVNNALTISAGVIQDSSGTVLSEARLAKAKADLAATNAANAKTAADNAKTAADNAATKAGQAVTSITTAETNLTTKLNNVESKLNTVQTNLTNISTLLPPILSDVTGYNAATATTSTSFKVSLDYSNATEYRYKLDSGAWSAWTSLSSHDTNGYLTVSVSTNGAHTLSIEIQNSSTSLTAKGKMTFFKL